MNIVGLIVVAAPLALWLLDWAGGGWLGVGRLYRRIAYWYDGGPLVWERQAPPTRMPRIPYLPQWQPPPRWRFTDAYRVHHAESAPADRLAQVIPLMSEAEFGWCLEPWHAYVIAYRADGIDWILEFRLPSSAIPLSALEPLADTIDRLLVRPTWLIKTVAAFIALAAIPLGVALLGGHAFFSVVNLPLAAVPLGALIGGLIFLYGGLRMFSGVINIFSDNPAPNMPHRPDDWDGVVFPDHHFTAHLSGRSWQERLAHVRELIADDEAHAEWARPGVELPSKQSA
jgi:hypothetical protein